MIQTKRFTYGYLIHTVLFGPPFQLLTSSCPTPPLLLPLHPHKTSLQCKDRKKGRWTPQFTYLLILYLSPYVKTHLYIYIQYKRCVSLLYINIKTRGCRKVIRKERPHILQMLHCAQMWLHYYLKTHFGKINSH